MCKIMKDTKTFQVQILYLYKSAFIYLHYFLRLDIHFSYKKLKIC